MKTNPVLDCLIQATQQLELDYEHTPLDGRKALIDKFKAVISAEQSHPRDEKLREACEVILGSVSQINFTDRHGWGDMLRKALGK